MPVNIYRRHRRTCQHKTKNSGYNKCDCPIYADGLPLLNPTALGTNNWTEASRMALEIQANGGVNVKEAVAGPLTILEGKAVFFDNLTVRNLSPATKGKHATLWRQVFAFAASEKLSLVTELNASAIDRFVKTWKDAPLARGKKLERLRQFFKFARSRKWIMENPTEGMKAPIVKSKQTPPFTPNEMIKILAEAERAIHKARSPRQKKNAILLKALILFMRFSGLRIGDAVGCQIEWVKDGRVRRFAQKNNRHIDVELPAHVIRELAQAPAKSDLYWFWTGNGQLKTAANRWQALLLTVFKNAGIHGGHSHRFRDTFAVALLERGESLQAVADALGDTLPVAQKHYNPWSKLRQSKLDEAVRGSWKNDPVLKALDEQAKQGRVM